MEGIGILFSIVDVIGAKRKEDIVKPEQRRAEHREMPRSTS